MLYVDGVQRVVGASLKPAGELRWYGKVGGRSLPAGRYALAVVAVDRAGQPLAARQGGAGADPVRRARIARPAREGRRRAFAFGCSRMRAASRGGSASGAGVGDGPRCSGSAAPQAPRPLPARRLGERPQRRRTSSSWRGHDARRLDRRRARARRPCSRSARRSAGWWYHEQTAAKEVRGSSTVEFVPRDRPRRSPAPAEGGRRGPLADVRLRQPADAPLAVQRTGRRTGKLWMLRTRWYVEFPPAVGYGKVFVSQLKGVFYAVDAKTGEWRWRRKFPYCSAASPTLARRARDRDASCPTPCTQGPARRAGARDRDAAVRRRTVWRVPDRRRSRRRSSSAGS